MSTLNIRMHMTARTIKTLNFNYERIDIIITIVSMLLFFFCLQFYTPYSFNILIL
jgi:hypothetical protein